ncbi:hypothetical protein LTR78_010980 [Recurvomyces mirabilis]|uniref:F-box domain-containing protein n=1 Tax=Recurvomyces mirabilis TaxID=574656 RepID=A0AAE0TM56_9PEZI|nr:hypothetical protein LTR78_010980 [Recurvomyces mirabilis]KAK5149411.1 hypothetical protein LTS14_010963 [Recurvomyces mirabilis]
MSAFTPQSRDTPSSQQANILTILPSELLVRIFSYLSTPPSSDIAAYRLVNRAFEEQSSPFPPPVLQHPYFRQYVEELVYDGSSYHETTATDWDQYVEDCEHAPRDLKDPAWVERQRRDHMAWNARIRFARPNARSLSLATVV